MRIYNLLNKTRFSTFLLLSLLLYFPVKAFAQTDMPLAPITVPLEYGNGFASGAVSGHEIYNGRNNSESLVVEIPTGNNIVIKQVFAYWGGRVPKSYLLNWPADTSLTGIQLNGTLITGDEVFLHGNRWNYYFTFRQDITNYGFINSGRNSINVTQVLNGILVPAISILVIYERVGEPIATITVSEGHDWVFSHYQVFNPVSHIFQPDICDRFADIHIFASNAEAHRPDGLNLSSGNSSNLEVFNVFRGTEGHEVDILSSQTNTADQSEFVFSPFLIPSGENRITLDIMADNSLGGFPDSINIMYFATLIPSSCGTNLTSPPPLSRKSRLMK